MDQLLYELPDGWEWKKLGDMTTLITKGTTPTTAGYKFEDSGINFIKIESIIKGVINKSSINSYISIDAYEALGRSQLEEGDLLFSIAGSIGTSALVTKDILPANTNQALAIIRGYEKYALPNFLLNALRSSIIDSTKAKKRGGALQNISLVDIKNAEIPLPPLSEQKRIVEKLDALLSRIDQAVNNLQESLGLAEALFASELNIVFSVIEDRQEIAALAEVKGGKRLPKGCQLQDEKTDYPYIRVSDFNDNGSIDVLNVKFITKEVQEKISRYTITKQDLYISIAGTIGKTGFVPQELDGANLTENAAKLVIKNRDTLFLNYLYYFTKTSDFASQAGLATKQVAQPKLALTRLSKIQIPLCDISQQKRIVKKLDQVAKNKEELKDKLQGQIDDLNALKASLLDAAFRGEL